MGKTETTVRNSGEFVRRLKNITIRDEEVMVSFDVVSLFTNVPTDLAVKVTRERLDESDDWKTASPKSADTR